MSAPRTGLTCMCGHNRMSHEVEAAPACVHDDCDCSSFRTVRTNAPSSSPAPLRPESLSHEALIARSKQSDRKTIVAHAEKAQVALDRLRRLVDEDRHAAQARREIAVLERQLAEARAKLRGDSAPAKAIPCIDPACARTFASVQGRAVHVGRSHPEAASA